MNTKIACSKTQRNVPNRRFWLFGNVGSLRCLAQPSGSRIRAAGKSRKQVLSKINFSVPIAGKFAALGIPVGGATGVLYARRSADRIVTGGRYRIRPRPIHEQVLASRLVALGNICFTQCRLRYFQSQRFPCPFSPWQAGCRFNTKTLHAEGPT